jgi:mRNA interferase RelE/StbE
MKQIAFSREAFKTLTHLPANGAKLIRAKIEQYARSPTSLANNVRMLKGEAGFFRLRVGDWRVIFREDATTIAIVRIGSRGSAYE